MSDLIERDAVLDVICDNCKFETDLERYMACSTCKDVEMIKAIPSARPKGEWIWNENGMDWGIGCWCCSECGMRNPYIGSGDTALLSNPHNWAGSKYCPNCGADMREREDK